MRSLCQESSSTIFALPAEVIGTGVSEQTERKNFQRLQRQHRNRLRSRLQNPRATPPRRREESPPRKRQTVEAIRVYLWLRRFFSLPSPSGLVAKRISSSPSSFSPLLQLQRQPLLLSWARLLASIVLICSLLSIFNR